MMDILDKLDTIFALAILMSTDMGHTDTLETFYTLDILDIIDMLDISDWEVQDILIYQYKLDVSDTIDIPKYLF